MKMFRFLPPSIAVGVLLSLNSAQATPYASGLTNNGNGTMSFYLNEAGGSVTITYEDNTTNASFNGTTTGTNLPTGIQTFSVAGHTGYSISVFKVGTGVPTLIKSSAAFTPRGVAVNTRAASPYFGTVYADISGGNINVFHSDFTSVYGASRSGGQTWAGGGLSPYRLSITPDDYLMVGDASSAHAGVYRIDPTVSTSQLVLGPIGEGPAGTGNGNFGTIQSRPFIIGNPSTGPFTLMEVDGDYPAVNGYNSLLIYTNLSLASLPHDAPPDIQGPDIGVPLDSEALGDNEYPGLSQGTNGYIYASTYRNNLSNPLIQIYDSTGTNQIWNSYGGPSGDYFLTTSSGITQGLIDSSVSADQEFVVGLTIDNWLVICPLTNGIPNVQNLYLSTPTSYTGNGRGVAFDAADNIYLSSSGLGLVQSWSLGLTATAVTTGTTNGSTGFQFIPVNASVNVGLTNQIAYQANNSYVLANGGTTAVEPTAFTLNLASVQTAPIPVSFTLTGTATNGVNYTASTNGVNLPAASSYTVVFPPGVTNETVLITPTANPVSGPTLSVILTLKGGPAYSVIAPFTETAYIASSGPQVLVLGATSDPSMYRANANDFAIFKMTRYGDTNASSYSIPPAAFTLGGAAVFGTDYTAGPQPVNFATAPTAGSGSAVTVNTGDLSESVEVGLPQLHSAYTGNLPILVTGSGGTSPEGTPFTFLTNTTSLVLLDNLYPPEAILWSDPLTNAADSTNWTLAFENTNTFPIVYTNYPNFTASNPDSSTNDDFDVEFGYDVSADGVTPSLTMQSNGWTTALKMTVNKLSGFIPGSPSGASGGVNVYPNGKKFGGNYAVRFSMNLVEGTASTTEFNMFGINHYGTNANWFSGDYAYGHGTTNNDGLFFWIDADTDGAGNIAGTAALSGQPLPNTGWATIASASLLSYSNIFKSPVVYNASPAGAPSDLTGGGISTWADVEIKQYNKVVTMSINKTVIFTYTNTTIFTNGEPMLGYDDPFASVGADPGAAAYYSNLRVVSLSVPTIISSALSGGNLIIQFTSPDAEAIPSSFTVGSTTNLATAYKATASTITQSGDIFTAVVPYSSTGSKYFAISQSNDTN